MTSTDKSGHAVTSQVHVHRVAAGGPVDVWGFSLGALTATSLALRHPGKVRRLVLAASHIRPDGGRLLPVPRARLQPVVHDFAGWTNDEIRSLAAPTFLVIGDRDFVRLDHAAEMLDLIPDCRLAVLPATSHTEVMQRADALQALVRPFLA